MPSRVAHILVSWPDEELGPPEDGVTEEMVWEEVATALPCDRRHHVTSPLPWFQVEFIAWVEGDTTEWKQR